MDDRIGHITLWEHKVLANDVVEPRSTPVDQGHLSSRLRLQSLGLHQVVIGAKDGDNTPAHHVCGMRPDEGLSTVTFVSW